MTKLLWLDTAQITHMTDQICYLFIRDIWLTPVVYATDRSKAVVPVLFLFFVAL